jgi:hypothetical protein
MSDEWPTTYKIKSRDWEIEYVDRLKDQDSDDPEDPDNDLLGCTRKDLRKVYVSLDQCRESLIDTLWHELVHCCYATSPIAGEHASETDREEVAVLFATEAAFEIIKNATSNWWA